jgi:hypothetical protein
LAMSGPVWRRRGWNSPMLGRRGRIESGLKKALY